MAPMKRVSAATSGLDMTPFKTYEQALRKRVDKGCIPGYCSAVIYQGKLLHCDAYGYADQDTKLKYGPDTICRLYCMSKPFVATGILLLHDRGLLKLDDPVQKYVPSFRGVKVVSRNSAIFKTNAAQPKPFTIKNCLTHSAGLPYGTSFNEPPSSAETKMCLHLVQGTEEGRIASLEQFVDELAKCPLRFAPGERYGYSYGLDVLGRVIEVVSGMKLSKFLRREIFAPLGMQDTDFSVPKSKAKRLAALYASRDSAIKLGVKPSGLSRAKGALCRIDGSKTDDSKWLQGQNCPVESGGGFMGTNMGGLVSTVNDCARFLAMISLGGEFDGKRILQESTVKQYCLPDLFPQVITGGKKQRESGRPFGWSALGEVGVPRTARDAPPDTKDDFEIGECGGGGAACTYWSINPSRELAILWFTQSMDNDPYVKESENIYVAGRRVAPLKQNNVKKSKLTKGINMVIRKIKK